MPTLDEAVQAGAEGFRQGMLAAAEVVERLIDAPLPDTPGISANERELIDAARKATLQNVASLLRKTVPGIA